MTREPYQGEPSGTPRWYWRTVIILLAIIGVASVVIVNQRTDDRDDEPSPFASTQSDGATPCADPVGRPTNEVVDEHQNVTADSCVDEAGNVGYAGASYECTDGRTLHFDATGWGYSDGVWQAHTRTDGTTNPPDAEEQACLG